MARTGLEELTPEMAAMMADYFGTGEVDKIARLQHLYAEKAKQTEMPQGMMARDQYIAPSIFGVLGSTLERIKGGQESNAAIQQMQGNVNQRNDINRQMMMADLMRRQKDAQEAQYAGIPSSPLQAGNIPSAAPENGYVQAQATDPLQEWMNKMYDPATDANLGASPAGAPAAAAAAAIRKPTVDPRGRSAGVTSPYFGFGGAYSPPPGR